LDETIPAPTNTDARHLLDVFDWSSTSLGKKSSWPEALVLAVNLCFSHRQPALIAWGTDLIQIYNNAYGKLIALKHPESFGSPGGIAWEDQWDDVGPLLNSVLSEGKSYHIENHKFLVSRKGYPEECYFTYSYKPLSTAAGIQGIFVTATETTEQVLANKRIKENEDRLRFNESRSRLAIEATGMGTFEHDAERDHFTYTSRLAQIFGYTETDVLTHSSFKDRIHPEDQHIRLAAVEALAKTDILFYEARVLFPDKTIHWVRLNGVMLQDPATKTNMLFGTALDITESRDISEALDKKVIDRTASLLETINALKQSEERYYRIVAEVEDYAIILLDKEGTILNWNKGAEKIKQYKESEIIGKNFRIFYQPQDQVDDLPHKLIAEAANNGRAGHEGWRIRRDGTKFWGNISITALHDEQQNIIGFLKVTRDLTERKAAEDKLLGYTRELETKNKELEQFAFVASHDLQEPLRKIQTFAEFIENNIHDPAAIQNYLDKINVSAHRMRELIRATLNYSSVLKDEPGALQVDLNKILAEVETDMELLIQQKKAVIHNHGLPVVNGIAIQLSQVFANLIGNAIKFADKIPVIAITSSIVFSQDIEDRPELLSAGRYFEIVFRDNGIGFEPQYENRIFSIFQRLHGKHEYEGTGIGLALCKKIIENHHGFITAKSELGKGAVFYIYLPAYGVS
jgi:PAS domain S-box-containing protein